MSTIFLNETEILKLMYAILLSLFCASRPQAIPVLPHNLLILKPQAATVLPQSPLTLRAKRRTALLKIRTSRMILKQRALMMRGDNTYFFSILKIKTFRYMPLIFVMLKVYEFILISNHNFIIIKS